MRLAMIGLVSFALGSEAAAAPPVLTPAIQPLAFLVGHWTAVDGKAENGVAARGVSEIEPVAGGGALIRRDRTDLIGPDGKAQGGFEQVMLIYPEAGALHGDYFDGTHVIHYMSAAVDPARSVSFLTADSPGAPRFRLTYTAKGSEALTVRFEMQPPGAPAFRTVAEGEVKRD